MLAIKVTNSACPPYSTVRTIDIAVLDSTRAVEDEDQNDTYTLTLTPSYGLVVHGLYLVVSNQKVFWITRHTISMHLIDGKFTLTQISTIQLTDTNEAPTGITLSSYYVHEHSPKGSVI